MRGFTLIEIMLALLLSTVLMAALYKTFFLSETALTDSDRYMTGLQEAREVFEAMRKEIESSFISAKDTSVRFKVLDRDEMGHKASAIYFTTFGGIGSGVKEVAYFVRRDGKKFSLMKTMLPSSTERKAIEFEAISDINNFTVSLTDEKSEVKSWDSKLRDKMPDSVNVTIGFMIKNKTFILSETIYPKIKTKV
ncbi:PilW family protein [Candidatus Magnetomonas plexicatena]|uniref:PilW family protein n=1 Tax=Candidatus Magnetomonas plexicatena TaxID=2552947 RepID=UPI001C75F5BC|nr:prepilin-type N-terminal cleavage/methylation domain-containing protein [Nitrospirales bacterium LBB_01]